MIATLGPRTALEATPFARMLEHAGLELAGLELTATVLVARVNHGRWIVDCPEDGCNGAELPFADGFFLCGSCIAERRPLRLFRVDFGQERQAVEAALERRPKNARNWLPGEPVEHLMLENQAHGIGARQ